MNPHQAAAVALVLVLSASTAYPADEESSEPLISVAIQGETLSSVIRQLCEPNGYLCAYSPDLTGRSGPHLSLAPTPASRAFGIVAAAYGACARMADGDTNTDREVVVFVPCEVPQRVSTRPVDEPKVILGVVVRDGVAATKGEIRGAEIGEILEQGTGYAAGLRVGDVIMSYNGAPVTGGAHLTKLVANTEPGDGVLVTVVRGAERLSFNVQF